MSSQHIISRIYIISLQGMGLTDRWLSVGVLAWSLPIMVVLIVMFCFNVRLETVTLQNEVIIYSHYNGDTI